MKFVSDPSIANKIAKMKQRVLWRDPLMQQQDIDQTRLFLDDGREDSPEFSFLVLGDSGSGPHRGHNPQRQIAEQMLPHRDECRFILHTGDVVYLVGSSEYYPKNFIEPYRDFLVGGERYKSLAYDRMVFNLPFLPVPGNHDYYDLPFLYGVLAQAAFPIRRLLESRIDLDVGWRGSGQGNVYARAFLDYLKAFSSTAEVTAHLDRHYTIKTNSGYCLRYQPGHFTRLPNRYYTFRVGGIDFFALDSNTFNEPEPPPPTPTGDRYRKQLENQRADLDKQILEILGTSANLDPNKPEEEEQLDDLHAKLEQLEEVKQDIDKQLAPKKGPTIDLEQLEWLQQRLIESWHTKLVRGRVIFFHHPPYVTEATKWHQAQTLTVRRNIRRVLDAVAESVKDLTQGRPVVDLVLNGHAHCLEYLRTVDTGHADAHTNWIVCGGSGYSLRRQRQEGTTLTEACGDGKSVDRAVAKSHLYVGRSGQGSRRRRPYSCLRIDVQEGTPPKFVVRPIVSEYSQRAWQQYELDGFAI